VIVFATLTGFGAGGANFSEAELRSQDMLLALLSVPAIIGSFSKQIIGLAKGILGDVHDGGGVCLDSDKARKSGNRQILVKG